MLAFAALAGQSACETTTSPARYNPPDPPVASVAVYPESISLLVGASGMVRSVVRDSTGAILWARSPVWTTSDSNVALVTGVGMDVLVAGRGPGRTTLTASSGGKAPSLVPAASPSTVRCIAGAPFSTTTPNAPAITAFPARCTSRRPHWCQGSHPSWRFRTDDNSAGSRRTASRIVPRSNRLAWDASTPSRGSQGSPNGEAAELRWRRTLS
jgi:hypothetical protein